MRIAELLDHHEQCVAYESRITGMLRAKEFPAVFSVCEESLPHIVPAIQYRKKKSIEPETPSLLAFRAISKYAPAFFEHAAMETLLTFVKSNRLLANHEQRFLQLVESALECEEVARVLWNHIEQHTGFLQRNIHETLGIDQDTAVGVLNIWEEFGVIFREPECGSYRLRFRTRLDALVEGICPSCGVRGKGRKEVFFRATACKKCGAENHYHLTNAENE